MPFKEAECVNDIFMDAKSSHNPLDFDIEKDPPISRTDEGRPGQMRSLRTIDENEGDGMYSDQKTHQEDLMR